MTTKMPDVSQLTAFDRYVIRNVIVHELAKWQPDMHRYIKQVLTNTRIKNALNHHDIDVPMFFKCWIDLALRVTNIPNRSETNANMIWDPNHDFNYDQADNEDAEEVEDYGEEDFKSKLVFRHKRFHRIWFHDKVGTRSHLPMIIPISDSISYYLAFYILHLRNEGPYLFNGRTPWSDLASDVKLFIDKSLHLRNIIQTMILHNMRHIVADTIGVVTNFNMSIMNDVSLVMRHTHQMQQTHYATGTKWGQVSTSLHDHQSYQPDGVKLWYPKNKNSLNDWEKMSIAIQQGTYKWGTTVITNVLHVAKLRKCPLINEFPLFQHFNEFPKKVTTTLQKSLKACFPHSNLQVNPKEFFTLDQLKTLFPPRRALEEEKAQKEIAQEQEEGEKPKKGKPKREWYEVEHIVDTKTVRGRKKALVKWKGFPSTENSWAKWSDLNDALRDSYREEEKKKKKK
jgi:hypothetical protein